jgi:Flp pilus assembly pilin Flp
LNGLGSHRAKAMVLFSVNSAVRAFYFVVGGENGATRHESIAEQNARKGRVQMIQVLRSLHKDEAGQDVIEYVLIAAFITTGVIATIGTVGKWVFNSWTNLNAQLT